MLGEKINMRREQIKDKKLKKSYEIIKTYKGQTKTDTDKTDKTRQNKKMRVMICLFFFSKQENKRFLDIKKFYTK